MLTNFQPETQSSLSEPTDWAHQRIQKGKGGGQFEEGAVFGGGGGGEFEEVGGVGGAVGEALFDAEEEFGFGPASAHEALVFVEQARGNGTCDFGRPAFALDLIEDHFGNRRVQEIFREEQAK